MQGLETLNVKLLKPFHAWTVVPQALTMHLIDPILDVTHPKTFNLYLPYHHGSLGPSWDSLPYNVIWGVNLFED